MSAFPRHRPRFPSLLCGLAMLLPPLTAARAQVAGDQDDSFATGPNSDSYVRALALQSNGQVLVGGAFTQFRGAARNLVARLNPDGSLDAYNPGLAIHGYLDGAPNVYAMTLQPDGKLIVAGQFSVLGQTPGGGVARLNPDGSLDTTFNVGGGVVMNGGQVGEAHAVALLANGQILVGGDFTAFNGVRASCLVRLNANGSLDRSFNAIGAGIVNNGYGHGVQTILALPNGQIVIGGAFKSYDGVAAGGVAVLNADGSVFKAFNAGEGADYSVNALAVQGNGQVLVGGNFNTFDGVTIALHLVRLNPDGSLDTGYDPNLGNLLISDIDVMILQPDGTLLIGGDFRSHDGLINEPTQGVARLLADGTLDPAFEGTNSVEQGAALALQPDGKALVASNSNVSLVGGVTGDALRVLDLFSAPAATVVSGVKKVPESGSAGPATFVVSLSSAPSVKTVVHYAIKGSAVSGSDYEPIKKKIKFPPGVASKVIDVTPIDRGIGGNGVVSVKIILTPGTGYTLGAPSVAKDKIYDNH